MEATVIFGNVVHLAIEDFRTTHGKALKGIKRFKNRYEWGDYLSARYFLFEGGLEIYYNASPWLSEVISITDIRKEALEGFERPD